MRVGSLILLLVIAFGVSIHGQTTRRVVARAPERPDAEAALSVMRALARSPAVSARQLESPLDRLTVPPDRLPAECTLAPSRSVTVNGKSVRGGLGRFLGAVTVMAMLDVQALPGQPELAQTWLEGRIGDATVRMFVEPAGFPKDTGLWGLYYDTARWEPILLDGDWLAAGRMRLYEGGPSAEPRASLDLVLTKQGAAGTWTSEDGSETRRVQLRRAKPPAAFDVAIRNPRRFVDRRWPIELTYPAGWFVHVTDDTLVLRAADPESMMFDWQLACERGRGFPDAPAAGDPPVHFMGHYFRTSAGWRVESSPGPSSNCDHGDTCGPPSTRIAGRMTFMSAEVSYRIQRVWGYEGIGGAREYLLIDGTEWIHCFDRLLDSPDRMRPVP